MKTILIWATIATVANASLISYDFQGAVLSTQGDIFTNIEIGEPARGHFRYELDASKRTDQNTFQDSLFYVDVGQDQPVRFQAGSEAFRFAWPGEPGWAATRPATEVNSNAYFHINAQLWDTFNIGNRFSVRFVDEDGEVFTGEPYVQKLPSPVVWEEMRMYVTYDRDNEMIIDISNYQLVPEPTSLGIWAVLSVIVCCKLARRRNWTCRL